MSSVSVSFSLSRKIADWLDKRQGGRSEYIQKILTEQIQKETLEQPAMIKNELDEIESELEKINIRKSVLINKLSFHIKNTEKQTAEERQKMMEYIKVEKERIREKIKLIESIPGIKNLLKDAFKDIEKFNYLPIVDEVRKNPKFKNVDVFSLKDYVKYKKRGG